MATISKDRGINVSLSSLVSIVTLGGAFWLFAKPAITDAVAEELAQELEDTVRMVVQEEVAPVKGDLTNLGASFQVLLVRDIGDLRREIAREETRRTSATLNEEVLWSAEDAENLVNLRIELEGLQMALSAMTQGSDP